MGKCIIRCNVNNLLLSIIVLESVFLGWFLLGLFFGPAALFPYNKVEGQVRTTGHKAVKANLQNFEKIEDVETPEPWELSYGLLIGAGVLFVVQLKALIFLIVGYKRQSHRPLGVYLFWLIISNLFYIVLLTLAIVYAYDIPKYLSHPVMIPLLIFKGFFVLYELIALICAIRYFKKLRQEEGSNDETNKFIET